MGPALDPFVTLEHHLDAERGMPAHLDRHVTPVGIDQMKTVMVDLRPRRLALSMGRAVATVLSFLNGQFPLGQQGGGSSSNRTNRRRAKRPQPREEPPLRRLVSNPS